MTNLERKVATEPGYHYLIGFIAGAVITLAVVYVAAHILISHGYKFTL